MLESHGAVLNTEIHSLVSPITTVDGNTIFDVVVKHVISNHGIPETLLFSFGSEDNLWRAIGHQNPSAVIAKWLSTPSIEIKV